MLANCDGSGYSSTFRYIGLVASSSCFLLLFAWAIRSKNRSNRWMNFAASWLLIIYLASEEALIVLCHRKIQWTLFNIILSALFIACFGSMCHSTYRLISHSKRAASPINQTVSIKGVIEKILRLIRGWAGGAGPG